MICFPEAKPLEPCLQPFYNFSTKFSSDLFNRFWSKKVSNTESVSFEKVFEVVWKPVFDQCVKLLDGLHSANLKLSSVDELFKDQYSTKSAKTLINDITNLHLAVSTTITNSTRDSKWIRSAVDRMYKYWELCSYYEAARAFIKIRDTLQLTGDFSLVEKVAMQVCI